MLTYIIVLSVAVVVLTALIISSYRRRQRLEVENGVLRNSATLAEQRIAELKTHHQQELERSRRDHEAQLQQAITLVREQIHTDSERILRDRQQQLASTSAQQLAAIVSPIHDELKRMQALVDKTDRQHTSTIERLDATIRSSIATANDIGLKADRLAQALTGDNKAQGNFGELRLKQLLDNMGLKEGLQYEQQVTLRDADGRAITDDEGHRLQPDVILHFPDNRDIIIDSKVSLTAYEEYCNAPDSQRADALHRHCASVRAQVNRLSAKHYSKHAHSANLDFVIMYIFSEGALQTALAADPSLYKDAYDKRVIICGSNNLYALLRVLEATWKQMDQINNQQLIVDMANTIVERVQMFCERFQKIEDAVQATQRAIDSVKTITAQRGQSIVVAANKLVRYGATQSTRHKPLNPPEDTTPHTV